MILIQPSIDPVIVSFGFLEIRWYGLAYVIAFLIGIHLIKLFNKKSPLKISNKLIDDFFIWAVLGVILGGRIGYVFFYQIQTFIYNPLYIFYIWEGGMSFHGGLSGIILTIFLFTKKNKIDFFYLSDLISLVAPIGIFCGRLANFINIELYGRITNFPFAMIYPAIDMNPRHPSQLYEALFEGIILFLILLFIYKKKFSQKQHGEITSFFLFFYGIFRFVIEFLREPDPQIGLFVEIFSMGQLLSIPLIIIGIIIYIKKNTLND